MNYIFFLILVIVAGLTLNFFYKIQRTFFKRSYYAFYELITGLPSNLTFTQIFFIRFIPPFLISFLSYYFLNKFIEINFVWYALIGTFASLTTSIKSLIDIRFYKGTDTEKHRLRNKINSLYLIYFFYILSFVVLSGFGSYMAYLFNNFNIGQLLPSKQGLIDAIWIGIIIYLFNKSNKPLI